jgi:peptidoglycan hydrolase-like protein with peptidoglycan-binding domain
MKYGLALFFLTMLAGSAALPQSNTTTNPATKKPPAASTKAAPKTVVAGSRTGSSKKTVSSKKGKSTKKPAVAASTYRQLAPTPDRYKEIQQALIDKGYLKSEANGVWDAPSQDALRQFQTDQKLSPTGKISAASLIALGLGPKTSAASVSPPPTGIDSAAPATPPPTTIDTPPPAASPPAN